MKIAVVIPCLNEELTIARVVGDCRRHLPDAEVYVLDNGSEDRSAEEARAAGAVVVPSPLRGKGQVLRHAFRVIAADYYVMVDGDGTYPVAEVGRLLRLAYEGNYEMVMGARLQLGRPEAFRPLHYLGNRLFTTAAQVLFGYPVQDLLTGFRVFSRRFAGEIRLISDGFEVETEMTIRAMAQNLSFCEVPIPYCERPVGSRSKLRTFRDGWRIGWLMLRFLREFRPLPFFTAAAVTTYLIACVAPPLLGQTLSVTSALFIGLGFFFSTQLTWRKLLDWPHPHHQPHPNDAGKNPLRRIG
jgi:glycosyltransferase involved in cell wall biosynthesis